jgi:carbonic anhydrase
MLRLAAASAIGLALGSVAVAKDAKAPPKPENVVEPEAALRRLLAGNARYVDGLSRRHNFKHEREALASGQNPSLRCSAAPIPGSPPNMLLTRHAAISSSRIAGNFASDECIASLEYAVSVLSTPLILVLGHEACGAVDATLKSVKDGINTARTFAIAGQGAGAFR